MKIKFDCLGFSTAFVFVEIEEETYHVGYLNCYSDDKYSFALTQAPVYALTSEEVIDEYKNQFKEKGVFIFGSLYLKKC